MVIFHSYVSLPEGIAPDVLFFKLEPQCAEANFLEKSSILNDLEAWQHPVRS